MPPSARLHVVHLLAAGPAELESRWECTGPRMTTKVYTVYI